MQYVAFLAPNFKWDGYDWLYALMEDRNYRDYEFFLVEAASAELARKAVVEQIYLKKIKAGGSEYVVEDAFLGFCALEHEENELVDIFGGKDATVFIELYEKYTWDAFFEDQIKFCENFEAADRKKFYELDDSTLKKLHEKAVWPDVLVAPITSKIDATHKKR